MDNFAAQEQQRAVKESLICFVDKYITNANYSLVDNIVLSYVISILEETLHDPVFDVEAFIDMMESYVPNFSTIEPALVVEWVLSLEFILARREEQRMRNTIEMEALRTMNGYLAPSVVKAYCNREENQDEERADFDACNYAEQCRILHEMFPNSCIMEIKHCVSIACGDIDRAAGTLLYRREHGQALSPVSLQCARNQLCDDNEIKHRIIERYSYVDKSSDTKEHKPLAPKMEPKKLVRYRDNKIVSLKGERYTEVPKSGSEEDNLKKPKKHSP